MNKFRGKRAVAKFVEHYTDDIKEYIAGDGLPAQIRVPMARSSKCITLDGIGFHGTAGDSEEGVFFSATTKKSLHLSYDQPQIILKPESDLGFLIESQALPHLAVRDFEYPPVQVFDIASFIPHNDTHHDVNFVWIEALTDVAISNKYRAAPGKALFDYMESLARSLGIERALLIGERARLYKPIFFDRMQIYSTCTRPADQKMHKDVVEIPCYSSYKAEAGLLETDAELESKPHMVDRRFMQSLDGKRVGILDDVDGTRHTLGYMIAAVKERGGIPVPITVDGLEYVYTNPELLKMGLIAELDVEVNNIFRESEEGIPRFTEEMKQAWRSGYHPRK